MSCKKAPQVICMNAAHTKRAAVDLTDQLRTGVTLTGTPTVTISPSGPTLSAKLVNTAAITINGVEAAIGKAVTFLIAGGSSAAGTYTITVLSATTDSETVGIECTLILE